MSLSPSHDQLAPAVTDTAETKHRSGLVELAVAIGFTSAVSFAMIVWLYMLALALWDGLRWLIS
jgi:hypothetical protein